MSSPKHSSKASLTKQIIAILESRGPTDMEIQLRYRPSEIEANRKRLARDLVRVGRLAKKSDAEILDSLRKHNPAAAPQPRKSPPRGEPGTRYRVHAGICTVLETDSRDKAEKRAAAERRKGDARVMITTVEPYRQTPQPAKAAHTPEVIALAMSLANDLGPYYRWQIIADQIQEATAAELERVKQQRDDSLSRELSLTVQVNALMTTLSRADEISADLACMTDATPEGRKARAMGEKLHKIIANAEKEAKNPEKESG